MPRNNAGIPPLIVALGASNTAGYGVGTDQAYPAVLGELLAASGIAVIVRNAGISGNTTGEMLARLDSAVPPETRLVLLQPGSNDARRGLPPAVREENIRIMTARLAARHIPVVRVAAAFEAARPGNLQPDDIHYTEAGHREIARHLLDEVVASLRR